MAASVAGESWCLCISFLAWPVLHFIFVVYELDVHYCVYIALDMHTSEVTKIG